MRGRCGLQHAGSLIEAHGLSYPAACGILVPRPGIEPASPALEGGFFTAGPPGKSPDTYILFQILFHYKLLEDIEYGSLYYTVGPCCLSILYMVVCIY